jgi:hypothetical protein
VRKCDRLRARKLKLRHERLERVMRCRAEFELVFGFVDADSFRYFDNIYNPRIKFISKYLRHMVIYCEKNPIKFHGCSGEIFVICPRFCITLANFDKYIHSCCHRQTNLFFDEIASRTRPWQTVDIRNVGEKFGRTVTKTPLISWGGGGGIHH